jgi:predicted helicase
MYAIMCGTVPKPRPKILPRDDQNIAIRNVIDGFSNSDRGQLILPCGTGKTLMALWIKEAMKSIHTLFIVPSLGILSQAKKAWMLNNNDSEFTPYICVCSAKDITKDDNNITYAYEINGRVSTNVDEVKAFLLQHNKTIVYSTYQSLHIVAKATKELDFIFDLAVCDEAHKTIGSKKNPFTLVHDNAAICIKKRLYMTATPRVLTKTRESYYDMSNTTIFGTEFHRMSFKEAIDQGILVDYKIAVIGISDEEIMTAIHNKTYIPESGEETVYERAHHYALNKFMKKFPVTHMITFHSSVKKAKLFNERNKIFFPEIDTYHVNGAQTTSERSKIMMEFENSERAIITNARCLTEGIDVPAIDVVYFCDPKNSKIDIV